MKHFLASVRGIRSSVAGRVKAHDEAALIERVVAGIIFEPSSPCGQLYLSFDPVGELIPFSLSGRCATN